MELDTYYICLLRKGPAWTAEESPGADQLQADHLAHIVHLRQTGATVAAGPVADESGIRGFSIFRTATLAEARALAEDDPGVRSGHYTVELHEWRTPRGTLPAPSSGVRQP